MNNTENPWMAAKNLNNPDSDDYSPKNEYTEGNFNLHNQLQKASVLTKILFLSKRGMSRSPLAREMMQKLISNSEFFRTNLSFHQRSHTGLRSMPYRCSHE